MSADPSHSVPDGAGKSGGNTGRSTVSVIIPVYRDDRGLARCLEALRAQDFPRGRFEVIVVNNDPGRPADVSAGEGLPLRTVEEPRPGSYAARNAGIRRAKGDVLAFTDADCVPSESWLSAGVAMLERGEADLVAGEVSFFFENPPPGPAEYLDAATKLNQRVYAGAGFGATANLFVRREVVEEVGPFDAALQSGGDYEFGRRATAAGFAVAWSPEAGVRHPARRSARALLRKSARVARGQKELARRGVLEHGRIGLRNLLPQVRVPQAQTEYRLSPWNYLKAVALMNLRKYLNIWIRWTA